MARGNIPRTCQFCTCPFLATSQQVNQGGGKFCSRTCHGKSRTSQKNGSKPTVERACQYCGKKLFTFPNRIRRGLAKYCSRPCARRGSPSIRKTPLADRFWTKVAKADEPNGCWLWTGRPTGKGYGSLVEKTQGSVTRHLAHRFSYELHNGPIEGGLCVLHKCDTPLCVNPTHLFLGTKMDNSHDMVKKNRTTSPLSAERVTEIRAQYARGGVTMKELGRQFGVHQYTIRCIVNRKRWAHVP